MSKGSPRTSVLRDNDLIQKGQDDLIRRGDVRELLQQCGLMGTHQSDPLAVMFNEIAAAQPTVKPLDRMLAEAREISEADKIAIRNKALREAAEILDDEGWLGMSMHRIRALITKGDCVVERE